MKQKSSYQWSNALEYNIPWFQIYSQSSESWVNYGNTVRAIRYDLTKSFFHYIRLCSSPHCFLLQDLAATKAAQCNHCSDKSFI
jgi:hypothetical protein